jgi:tetratricopeptide (TPR) repeat protein
MSVASNAKVGADSRSAAGGWSVLTVAAVLMLAALGAYWNSFNVPLLLDDNFSISGNSSIRHPEQIGDVLSPSAGTTAGRPLLNLTFALNYAAGGTSVQGYHVVNLLIHVCAGLALLGIVRRTLLLPALRGRYGDAALPLAAVVALLWTLHPLQTESVTYISQRAESLMGLFYLLTLYCFIRSVTAESRNCWLILSVATCLCGMATKQVMVTAPVLVLLYDWAFVSGSIRSALANRRWYYASLAATWLLLGFLMHRSSLTAVRVGFQAGVSWMTYALTELRVVTDYLKLAFWPHPLVFDYGTEILAVDLLAVVPFALIIAALLVGAVVAWRRSPMAGFLGCWFFLILAPTSTVVPIAAQPMAESRMYLPLAALVMLVTLLGYALGRRRALVALGGIVVGLGALTARRNYDYRSEASIWEDTVARLPHSARGHGNLGMALAAMPGRLPDAIAHYEAALRLKPDFTEAHYNLANALAQMPGRLTAAAAHYETALRLRPNYAAAHFNFANALARMPGQLPNAIAHYEAALRLKPDFAEVQNNLGIALAKIPGRQFDAIAHFEEALRLKPTYAEAHYNLASALAAIPGRLPAAIANYEEALRLNPTYAEAHNNLANAIAGMPGRQSDAIAHFEEAVRLKPDSAAIHYNLANALSKVPSRAADAIAHYEQAVRLKPDFVEAHSSLAIVYAETGRLDAAIEQLEIAARLDPASATIRDNLGMLKARRK